MKSMFDVFGGVDPSMKLDNFNIKKTKRKYFEKMLKKNQKQKEKPISKELEMRLKESSLKKITLTNNIYTQGFLWKGFITHIWKFTDWLDEEESYPSYQDVEHILVITRQFRTIYRNLIEDNPELKETTVGLVGETLKTFRKKLVPYVKEYKKGFIESGRESWLR